MKRIVLGALVSAGIVAVVALSSCNGPIAEPGLPGGTKDVASFPPGATVQDLLAVVDEGLSTPGKGPDSVRFIVIRDGVRHQPAYRANAYHFAVGAGNEFPAGAIVAQRNWSLGGSVDGRNEELDKFGIAVAVEPGSQGVYGAEIVGAVRTICAAITLRVPVHPDCVVSMGEVPYANSNERAAAELKLVEEVRPGIPVPPTDLTLTLTSGDRVVKVPVEVRNTSIAINVGMMMRRRFDGENRGMLFVYAHRAYRNYWMRNCFIPIDLAYIYKGKIDKLIQPMAPEAGKPTRDFTPHESDSAIRYALEMPAGWFKKNGFGKGTVVEGLP